MSDPNTVTARAAAPKVVVTNHTDEPVYLFVVGRVMAARINWGAHVHGPGLRSGERTGIPYDEIAREPGETQAIVYWWKAVIENGERVPGEINSIVVNL